MRWMHTIILLVAIFCYVVDGQSACGSDETNQTITVPTQSYIVTELKRVPSYCNDTVCCRGYVMSNGVCVTGCPNGTYGENCTNSCSCPENAYPGCDNTVYPCPEGFYGDDCRHECGCQNNATCDIETGQCNCTVPGWTGQFCHLAIVRDWVQHDPAVDDDLGDIKEPESPCDLIIRQDGYVIEDVATGFGGHSVSLTCDARCKGPWATTALAWYKESSRRRIPATRRRLSSYSRSSSRVQMLIITYFLERDVGVYRCRGWLGPTIGWVEKRVRLQMGCSNPMISCDVSRCLPAKYRCDRKKQCEDGFDEYGCGPVSCDESEFYCDNRCKTWVGRCDGFYDCYDGTDELNCGPEIKTPPPTLPPFDYDDENTTESSETTAESTSSTVESISSLPTTSESTIPTATTTDSPTTALLDCQGDQFLCPGGECIPHSYVCDGVVDCKHGIDELDCGWPNTPTSESTSSTVESISSLPTTSESTIPTTTTTDSPTTASSDCQGDQFLCPDGKCIPRSYVCDGMLDCKHGIDESDCGWPSTPTYCDTNVHFNCWNRSVCIPTNWVCDGVMDCPDGDDEINCTETTESSVDVTTGTTSPPAPKTSGQSTSETVTSSPTKTETAPTSPAGSTTTRAKTTGTSLFTASKASASSTAAEITTAEATTHPTTERTFVCPGKFNCGQGRCIDLNQRCNNIPECGDDRDEQNCRAKSCPETQIACVDGKKCINVNQWGDGECDCEDGSDEANCVV